MSVIAYIPSPESASFQIGPLTVHAYGLCIALAVLVGVRLATYLWSKEGGSREDVISIVTWAVPFGIVGARLYHVVTDYELYSDDLSSVFYIWDGGLGIWGGIAGGIAAGLTVAKRKSIPLWRLLDIAAPSLAISQAIGRFGNYFNQELFGEPTTLPWGLQIDVSNRPLGYEGFGTFHPLFLYESIWNSLLCLALVALYLKVRPAPGKIFLIYLAGYTFARFFLEGLRVEFAHTVFGLRINEWMSLAIFIIATSSLIFRTITERKAKLKVN